MHSGDQRSAVRKPAERFVRGRGRYVADLRLPDPLAVVFRRSEHAHATLLEVTTDRALAMPGVVAVTTGADLERTDPLPALWNLVGQNQAGVKALATDRLRWVGQPLAAVVATCAETAARAAAAIGVVTLPLPAIASIEAAEAAHATRLYDHWDDNVVVRRAWRLGEAGPAQATAAARVRERFVSQRVHALSMETRGVLASWRPDDDGLTVWTSTQSIHQVRAAISQALHLPEHRIRVIGPDVGGAFGMKGVPYAEEVLLAWIAMQHDRPVRWIEERRESFVASTHGRDQQVDIDLSVDADGRIAALCADIVLDKGAEPGSTSIGTAWITGAVLTGPYAVPVVSIDARGVVTNKTPIGAYRGFGQPEANFAIECALDRAARQIGIDPAEIRRRNLVPPEAMPFPTATGLLLDSGRYADLLDRALVAFDWTGARRETAAARAAGKLHGVGLACYSEVTNLGPSALCGPIGIDSGGFDVCSIRMEPSGHVRVFTGQTPMGQGIETAIAQTCSHALTLPAEDIQVVYGDTLSCAYTAYASGGSRGAGVGAATAGIAAGRLAERLRLWGAHLLQRTPDQVVLRQGGVHEIDDPTRRVSVAKIAEAAWRGASVPPGLELGLEDRAAYDPAGLAISYGTAIVQVAIDAGTGAIELQRILFAHDCGTQINPQIVDGQIVGGIAQAIGTTLYEQLLYDEHAQPLTLSMRDYQVPLASDLPPIELIHTETPTPFSPNGAKGVGESGTIPIPTAIANAIEDALSDFAGPALARLPITPDKILARILRPA